MCELRNTDQTHRSRRAFDVFLSKVPEKIIESLSKGTATRIRTASEATDVPILLDPTHRYIGRFDRRSNSP